MKKIVYSKVVRTKLKVLKQDLAERIGEKIAEDTVTKIMKAIHLLSDNCELGVN